MSFKIAIVSATRNQALDFTSLMRSAGDMFYCESSLPLYREDLIAVFLLTGWEIRRDADEITSLLKERRQTGTRVFHVSAI